MVILFLFSIFIIFLASPSPKASRVFLCIHQTWLLGYLSGPWTPGGQIPCFSPLWNPVLPPEFSQLISSLLTPSGILESSASSSTHPSRNLGTLGCPDLTTHKSLCASSSSRGSSRLCMPTWSLWQPQVRALLLIPCPHSLCQPSVYKPIWSFLSLSLFLKFRTAENSLWPTTGVHKL